MKPSARGLNAQLHPLPTLVIPLRVWHKLMGYTELCPVEINGFGYIEPLGDSLWLDDVFILKQAASADGVVSDDEAFGRHVTEMVRAGMPTGRLRLQWHSHVWGEVYCSHTDEDNITELGDTTNWMVSLVVNKDHQAYAQLDVFQPFGAFQTFRTSAPLRWRIDFSGTPDDVLAACHADIDALVRTPRGRKLRLPPLPTPTGSTP